MFKFILTLLLLGNSLSALAHCPINFKPEKVCLMLDQNVIFVYDEKIPHTGPYKDFAESSILAVKTEGKEVKFSRVSRGIYRIEYAQMLKTVDLMMVNGKKKEKSKLTLNID